MRRISVAGGKATITLLRRDLIRLTWLPNTELLPRDAKDVLEQSLKLVEDVPYAILVDMPSILHMTAGAGALYGAEDMVLAAAMLGGTPMDRVLAASVMQSVHQVQFFTDESAALTWLISHLPDHSRQVQAGRERNHILSQRAANTSPRPQRSLIFPSDFGSCSAI